jgi:hypothetical protein
MQRNVDTRSLRNKAPHLEQQYVSIPSQDGKIFKGVLQRIGRKAKALLAQAPDTVEGVKPVTVGDVLQNSTWGADRGRMKRNRIKRRRAKNRVANRKRQENRRTGSGYRVKGGGAW